MDNDDDDDDEDDGDGDDDDDDDDDDDGIHSYIVVGLDKNICFDYSLVRTIVTHVALWCMCILLCLTCE